VTFSPDGRTIASGDAVGYVTLWNPANRRELRQLKAHSTEANRVLFSPDGKTLATGSGDARVKLWDVATGRELHALQGHTAPITFLAFSADSKTLATGSRDGTARLWDLTPGHAGWQDMPTSLSISSILPTADGSQPAVGTAPRSSGTVAPDG
jgi:WD40 repeat protein